MPFPPSRQAVLAKRSLLRSVSFFPQPATYKSRPSITTTIHQKRNLTTTPALSLPRKGNEDRESINTDSDEYTKSGTDDISAKQEEAAFDPKATKPETERKIAGEEKARKEDKGGKKRDGKVEGGNPLDISPANKDVSQQRGEQE